MDYLPISSPEQRTVLNVTIELWKQLDIRNEAKDLFVSCAGYRIYDEWKKLEKKVLENANQLSLPDPLKKEILATVKPLGQQIVNWMALMEYKKYCYDYLGYSAQYPAIDFINNFCWTLQGTIDEQETIKLFLDNQSLAIEYRYKLACIFCCENYVHILRNQLSEKYKERFDIDTEHTFYESKRLFDFWTCHIKEKTTRLYSVIKQEAPNDGLFKHMFKWSIKHNNQVAALYFWQKLTNTEKNNDVVEFATDAVSNSRTDILCFLLLQMDNVQQGKVFEKHPYKVLELIYKSWQYQDFFLSVANCMWRFLSVDSYFSLLMMIIKEKSSEVRFEYKYQKILTEFWSQSPYHLKKDIITNNQCIWYLLSKLLVIEDKASINLILNSANAIEKKQIALSKEGKNEYLELIRYGKWELLKIFIESIFMSDEEINDFKSTLITNVFGTVWLNSRVERWQSVEEFLNWRCSSEEKIKEFKQKITQSWGNELCITLISNEEWVLVEKYLNWRFCVLEEVSYFKQCLAKIEGKEFCASLIHKNNWELVEKFLNWCDFSSSEEINNFKHELARSKGIDLCGRLIRESNWELVERFLVWCCFSSAQETSNFKKEIGKDVGYNLCINFVLRKNLQSADKFLNWCFSSQEEINNFKQELVCSRGIEVITNFIYSIFCRDGDELQSIEEFLNWCFSSQEEINQFKREIISSEAKSNICINLMYEDKFQLAETFLKWSCLSELEIHRFKKELIFSDENIELCERFIDGEVHNKNKQLLWVQAGESNQWGLVYRLISWYSQPKEVIAEFRNIEFTKSWLSNSTDSEFNDNLTIFFDFLDEKLFRMFVEENLEEEAVNSLYKKLELNYQILGGKKIAALLIYHNKLQLVKEFLNWSFSAQEEIDSFKQKLASGEGIWLCVSLAQCGKLKSAEEFLNWCFLSEEKIIDFKQDLVDEEGVRLCISLIKNGRLQWVEQFLNWCLNSEEKVNDFKKELVSKEGIKVCSDLILYSNSKSQLQSVEQFLRWCFSSEQEMNSFKQELIDKEGVKLSSNLIIREENLHLAEQFLNWCFPSTEDVSNFKRNVLVNDKESICANLIYKDRCNLIETFLLQWCHLSNEEVHSFKKEFAHDRAISFCTSFIKDNKWHLVNEILHWGNFSKEKIEELKQELAKQEGYRLCMDLLLRDNKIQLAEQFLDWCFSSSTESINNFKKEQLATKKEVICIDLIYKGHFELAEEFLKWCCLSNNEINKFKKELMFSDQGIRLCSKFIDGYKVYDKDKNLLYEDKWALVNRLVIWYNQSKNIIIEFKEKIYESTKLNETDINRFAQLLDNSIQDVELKDEYMFNELHPMVVNIQERNNRCEDSSHSNGSIENNSKNCNTETLGNQLVNLNTSDLEM